MKEALREAFLEVRQGLSADRVVADPVLNQQFLTACRRMGLGDSDKQLNRRLLNARKASALAGVRTSQRTSFPHEEEYSFASEIAIRYLERRDGVTLDEVICCPTLAREFDGVAERISPGVTPLQYRWAALNLRKKRRLAPELLVRVRPPTRVVNVTVSELNSDELPAGQGLYVFFDATTTLYVGEAENLRNRLRKHLDHSDNKGLAHWIWEHGSERLNVELHVLPDDTSTKVRRALEAELIRSRNPEFNVKGK